MSPPDFDEPSTTAAEILRWDEVLDGLSYYELLGVTESDSVLDYERAFHRFALQFHPDCHPNQIDVTRDALTRIFQRGVEARRVLRDPQLHARYRNLFRAGAHRLLDEAQVSGAELANDLPRLHLDCRSAGAKLESMAAFRAWQQRDLELVQRRLHAALAFDGKANVTIEACLAAVAQLLSESPLVTKSERF